MRRESREHRVSVARRSEHPNEEDMLRHRYTPPDEGLHEQSGRQVSWLAGRGPRWPSRGRPSVGIGRLTSGAKQGADSLRTVAGAATVVLCSLLGPEGHQRHGIMPFFEQHNDAAALIGAPQRSIEDEV